MWKVSKYGVISGPHFPAFGLNIRIEYIQSECGKRRTRNNSRIWTLFTQHKLWNFDQKLRSIFAIFCLKFQIAIPCNYVLFKNFLTWYEVESPIGGTLWWMQLVNDLINIVTCPFLRRIFVYELCIASCTPESSPRKNHVTTFMTSYIGPLYLGMS